MPAGANTSSICANLAWRYRNPDSNNRIPEPHCSTWASNLVEQVARMPAKSTPVASSDQQLTSPLQRKIPATPRFSTSPHTFPDYTTTQHTHTHHNPDTLRQETKESSPRFLTEARNGNEELTWRNRICCGGRRSPWKIRDSRGGVCFLAACGLGGREGVETRGCGGRASERLRWKLSSPLLLAAVVFLPFSFSFFFFLFFWFWYFWCSPLFPRRWRLILLRRWR